MPNSLEKTKVAFEQWRQQREKKGPIPNRLIEQAVSLIGQHSKSKITQSLKINSTMLNRWLIQYQASNHFIELTTPANQATPISPSDMTMQITLPDGLTIHIQGTAKQTASLLTSLRDEAIS